jgi:hypothetical protein
VYTSPNIGHIDSPSEDQALYIYLGWWRWHHWRQVLLEDVVELHMVVKLPTSLWRLPLGNILAMIYQCNMKDIRETIHSTSKAIEDFDIFSKIGWISNMTLVMIIFSSYVFFHPLFLSAVELQTL